MTTVTPTSLSRAGLRDSIENIDYARDYIARGWEIYPIRSLTVLPNGKKQLDIGKWGEGATSDFTQVEDWFSPEAEARHPQQGIVIATGQRSNLFVVDIDNAYLWEQVITAEDGHEVPDTYRVDSQSGYGYHLYFKWPEGYRGGGSMVLADKTFDLYYTQDGKGERLAGIEIRENGNIVFAPPTTVFDSRNQDIVYGAYRVVDPDAEVAEVPQWLLDMYMARSTATRTGKSKSSSSSSSAVERIPVKKDEWPNEETLNDTAIRQQKEIILNHAQEKFEALKSDPGSLWDNGVTSVMGILIRVKNAPWFHFSEKDLDEFLDKHAPQDAGFTHKDHMRIKNSIQRRVGYEDVFLPSEYDEETVKELTAIFLSEKKKFEENEALIRNPLINIPEEFWATRPIFQQIRQKAHSRQISADAVLHCTFAAYAASIAHNYKIRTDIASKYVNLCYFTALVGGSGSGKGSAASLGREIANYESNGTPTSGEGIIDFFMEEKIDEDDPRNLDPKTGTLKPDAMYRKKVQTKHNALFHFDEGSEMAKIALRNGNTLTQNLLKAAMGEQLSTVNATESLKRMIPAGSYNMGMTVAFQVQISGELLDQTETGFAQRYIWAATNDANLPEWEDRKPDPGPFTLPKPRAFHPDDWEKVVEITVDDSIINMLGKQQTDKTAGRLVISDHDAHRPVKTLQMAGIIRLMDGPNVNGVSYHINEADWRLAEILYDTQAMLRKQLIARVAAGRTDEIIQQGTKDAIRFTARQEAVQTQTLVRERKRVFEIIDKIKAKGEHPAKISYITKNFPRNKKTLVEEQVLPAMVEEGALLLDADGVYSIVESKRGK